MTTLLLPDVSEFQSSADLRGIKKANGGAVILRACYGASHPDKVFARYRATAAALGYSFTGLYQYLTAGQDATAQAEAFCKLVGKLGPHEIPMLDLEEGSGNQAVRAGIWHTYVDGNLGLACLPLPQRSWLYSGLNFAETHGLAPVFASARRTWVAAYGSTEPKLGHTLWQCTDGKDGIHVTNWPGAGACDTNLYHGTLAQLAAAIRR
jgi:GH25 family lysozyme M1 (1,4-beta-N-acetylmuramidase)